VPEEKLKPACTPATNYLFKVRKGSNIDLPKQKASLFHSMVAKLLFVGKRARPDILLAVSFLMTRVKSPDQDDWKKLLRLMGYLKCTSELCLTLMCRSLNDFTWFIDGSYASHDDMRGQSGAVMFAGNCAVLFKSNKQKVNTRSSTKTEFIAIDDVLPTVQWTQKFLLEQGYDLETLIKEDNRSTILLMKNGKLSSGKRMKHLDVRYFYVKDLLDRGILKINHCVSDNMIADFLTKTIQGNCLKLLRDIILNRNYHGSVLEHRSMLGNSKENICSNTDQEKSERVIPDKREEMSLTGVESQKGLLKEELPVNQ